MVPLHGRWALDWLVQDFIIFNFIVHYLGYCIDINNELWYTLIRVKT